MFKSVIVAALLASASAFAPNAAFGRQATAVANGKSDWQDSAELGWSMGGEDYTRSVEPQDNDDARKVIPEGESFEEYMKRRAAEGN